jgi:hypothetical protein
MMVDVCRQRSSVVCLSASMLMCLGVIQTHKRMHDTMLGTCSVPILDKNLEFLGLCQESASLGTNLEILDTCQERFLVKIAFLTTPLSEHSPVNDALALEPELATASINRRHPLNNRRMQVTVPTGHDNPFVSFPVLLHLPCVFPFQFQITLA